MACAAAGIALLGVQTTPSRPRCPLYWGERWELYKRASPFIVMHSLPWWPCVSKLAFVLQDSTDPFSGLLVQLSAEQAGALSSGEGYLLPAVGNVVRVDGVVGHTLGNTVLEQVSAVTMVSPRVALPTPVPVTAATLASGCTYGSEQYRNMVVALSTCASPSTPAT